MAYNGSVVGSPTFAAAKFGNGLTAVSDSNYIDLPSGVFGFGSTDDWTIECWLLCDTVANAIALSSSEPTDLNAIWFGRTTDNFTVSVVGSGDFTGGAALDSGISINTATWIHCAMVMVGGTTIKTFVGGTPGATFTGVFTPPPNTDGTIGRFAPFDAFAWDGGIDEVAVWNYAKYSGSFTPPTVPYTGFEVGLRALYHLQADGIDSAVSIDLVPADDSDILYSPYNWDVQPDLAVTINSGAYFRVLCDSPFIGLQFDTSANVAPFSQFWARVDGQGWAEHTLAAGDPIILIETGMEDRKHLLEVLVKSTSETLDRWTDSETSVSLVGIAVKSGGGIASVLPRTKRVLVYGDSITEGVRAVNDTATDDTDRNDALGTYIYGLMTALDAEVGVVAFGGQGLITTGSGGVPTLPDAYDFLSDGVARVFSPAPDLIIVNEGTNDVGDIQSAYEGLIANLLSDCPDAKQLLLIPFDDSHATEIADAVTAVANSLVTSQSTVGWFDPADSSDGVHPYSYSGLDLIAPNLFPVVLALLYPEGSNGGGLRPVGVGGLVG